jgi:recombination protein RecT
MSETANVNQEIAKRGKPREKAKIETLLAGVEPAIVQSLGTPDGAKIVLRHYLNAIRYTPKLLDCSTESLAGACLLSAQLRLEPGPLGHVYFVPFGGECVWVLGYTGIAELAHRSGRVGDLVSEIVWDCDEYGPPARSNGRLTYHHQPGPVDARKERLGVLVTWQEKTGGKWFPHALAVPVSRIERAKRASAAAKSKSGPWFTDEDAMWRKTGIRAARPSLLLTGDALLGFESDNGIVADLGVNELGDAEPVFDVLEPSEASEDDGQA